MATTIATRRRNRPANQGAAPVPSMSVDIHQKLVWEYVDINDIVPYEFNPRDNADAISSVMESIKLVGFVIPIVLDADNVVVAGHTRIEAAKLLHMAEVPALRATHLSKEQLDAFRLIDNKVASLAKWDFDLLAGEISKLQDTGINWTAFGWTQEEIDCFSEVVAADCLNAQGVMAAAQEGAATTQVRRSPAQARIVIGEFVFFISAQQYRIWADGVRQLHDFNEVAITNELKRRLGMLE